MQPKEFRMTEKVAQDSPACAKSWFTQIDAPYPRRAREFKNRPISMGIAAGQRKRARSEGETNADGRSNVGRV
jgi:hypothetical protein